jgi:L-amino acid N-acyltransferase YncA
MVQHSNDNSNDSIMIRPATMADAAAVVAIYNHFVLETIVTFEEQPIDSAEMSRRIESVQQASLPWLVAEQHGTVLGYAYAGKWKERIGYRFSVESSVYCAPSATGRGLGTRLYGALLPLLRERGVHAVIGGIALPNDASVALHEKLGMRKVAHFEQTGFKFGRWIDVGYWQCLLTT